MEIIRSNSTEEARVEAYMALQEILDEDVPVIFLYAPQLKIVSDRSFSHTISPKRPGYFVNAIAE